MLEIQSKEAVVQNLKDAGCKKCMIQDFLLCYEEEKVEEQLRMLESQREELLERVHREERRISCLDYLIWQIKKSAAHKK